MGSSYANPGTIVSTTMTYKQVLNPPEVSMQYSGCSASRKNWDLKYLKTMINDNMIKIKMQKEKVGNCATLKFAVGLH